MKKKHVEESSMPTLTSLNASPKLDHISSGISLMNSFWLAFGSLMQQANYLSPHSMSGRIVNAVWWFFTFIMVSSYTANFAALLTMERMTTPITSMDELAAQQTVEFGTLINSATMAFFKVISRPIVLSVS